MTRNYTPQELAIPPIPTSLRKAAKMGATYWRRNDSHFILDFTGGHLNIFFDSLTHQNQEEIIKTITGSSDPSRLSDRRFKTLTEAFQATCRAMVNFHIKNNCKLSPMQDALLESFAIEMQNPILKFEHVGPSMPINLWIELPIFTDNAEISRQLYNKALFSNYNPETKKHTSFNAIPDASTLQSIAIGYNDISSITSDELIEATSTFTPSQNYQLPIDINETLILAIIQTAEILSKENYDHFQNQCILWVASAQDYFTRFIEKNGCTKEAISTLLFEHDGDIVKIKTPETFVKPKKSTSHARSFSQ